MANMSFVSSYLAFIFVMLACALCFSLAETTDVSDSIKNIYVTRQVDVRSQVPMHAMEIQFQNTGSKPVCMFVRKFFV